MQGCLFYSVMKVQLYYEYCFALFWKFQVGTSIIVCETEPSSSYLLLSLCKRQGSLVMDSITDCILLKIYRRETSSSRAEQVARGDCSSFDFLSIIHRVVSENCRALQHFLWLLALRDIIAVVQQRDALNRSTVSHYCCRIVHVPRWNIRKRCRCDALTSNAYDRYYYLPTILRNCSCFNVIVRPWYPLWYTGLGNTTLVMSWLREIRFRFAICVQFHSTY